MKPQHFNGQYEDFVGNDCIGRYVFLTGSDEKALLFSRFFDHLVIKSHPRQHNLYLGTILEDNQEIAVAAISSGMGGPSADIIINELLTVGVKRILRVGTAGSLQPNSIKVGDIIVALGAVRDDKASWDYIYQEYPALASFEYVLAANQALSNLHLSSNVHKGIVHSKSSLFAREIGCSLLPDNKIYMKSLRTAGVLASEMEAAQLFILTSLTTARLLRQSINSIPVLSGALLLIIGDTTPFSDDTLIIKKGVEQILKLSIETVKQLYLLDKKIYYKKL